MVLLRCFFMLFILRMSGYTQAASHHPELFLAQISGKTNAGELIVQHYCALCHAEKPQIPLGAPRVRHQSDWALRVEAGLAQLLQHTTEGYGAMPARGGCLECSDAQLLLAIQAMLP